MLGRLEQPDCTVRVHGMGKVGCQGRRSAQWPSLDGERHGSKGSRLGSVSAAWANKRTARAGRAHVGLHQCGCWQFMLPRISGLCLMPCEHSLTKYSCLHSFYKQIDSCCSATEANKRTEFGNWFGAILIWLRCICESFHFLVSSTQGASLS